MYQPISKYLTGALCLVLFAVVLAGCDSNEPDDDGPGETELITRVVLTLTGGGETISATANDPDGDGTNFQIDDIILTAGTTYTGSFEIADDINGEDITAEIEEENAEHQFFFTVGGAASSRVTVTINDQDENNLPVGLDFTVAVSDGDASSGTLRVILSHYDDEPKNGTDRSDETDFDITFPIAIQ
ncbi:MAG: type 1 periplasmic binding fold superfamily protein [Bacteroidota bacterium]